MIQCLVTKEDVTRIEGATSVLEQALEDNKLWVDTVWHNLQTAREHYPNETYREVEVKPTDA